jgi:hypothetical protein
MITFGGFSKGVIDKLDSIEDRLTRVEETVKHVDDQVKTTVGLGRKIGVGLIVWAIASGGLKFETLYKLIPGLSETQQHVNFPFKSN